jgi:hypothetical protein
MQGENRRPSGTFREAASPVHNYPLGDVSSPLKKTKKSRKRKLIFWIFTIVIISTIILLYFLLHHKYNDTLPYPLPTQTLGLLGFNIYYPNQKLLPSGYQLDQKSFSYSDQAVVYSVRYGNNQTIAFTDQAKPTTAQIQEFYSRDLQLSKSMTTKIGTAKISKLGSLGPNNTITTKTVVSLPTNTNAWIIITAPGSINQQNLKQVINSIELAK